MSPSGIGENTIKVFDADGHLLAPRLVEDSQLSPLHLATAPNGNVVVSCGWPFGGRDAISSVREYDSTSGSDGDLYCVARDEVLSFDFETGDFSGAIVNCSDLIG
jgi:hypothetical protein